MLKKAFFTPQGFYGVAAKSVTGLYAVSAVLFLVGFYLAFFVCPIDATQGHSYRILFIHVASAWMSMLIYVMMAVFSAAATSMSATITLAPAWPRSMEVVRPIPPPPPVKTGFLPPR